MEPFITHTGRAVPLRRSNVDTDQIIPAEYLKRVSRDGLRRRACSPPGARTPTSCSTSPRYAGATILVAGPDFGTGSSREHAVWALLDYGFRVVIAPRFGDIFRNNATKAGLLPVAAAGGDRRVALQDAVEADPAGEVTVDLQTREVRHAGAGVNGAVRDRRLHPLAADGGPGRHRADPAPRRCHY